MTHRFLTGALVGVAIGLIAGTAFQTDAAPPQPAPVLREDTIARVARQRTDSIVFLHTESTAAPGEEGLGSGVVIDVDGLILTNAHVVNGARVVHVRSSDGEGVEAAVLGSDMDIDVAALRPAKPLKFPAAPLGDSDRVSVGDVVVAIGNPLGLHHTVTSGIISAKARAIGTAVPFLQTDAALNPGSSGGALFDLRGRVIGITTGILSEGGQNVGLNVAIPINAIKAVLPKLVGTQPERRPGAGN